MLPTSHHRIPTVVRVFATVLAVLGGLAAVLVVRAAMMESQQPDVEPSEVPEVREGAAKRLGEAIRFETISPSEYDAEELAPFEQLQAYLTQAFPRVHDRIRREEISPCSLLYTWRGSNPDLKPALLMSHLDVVPVESELEEWEHPPFSGEIADGYIWGRGALDIKTGVIGILEAAETLLAHDIQPERTQMFAFGCDEEVGGQKGAKIISKLLKKRGVQPKYVLDEGQAITKGIVPGIEGPVALIGLGEKGYVTLELTAKAKGGHSMMPPKQTAVGILSEAITRIEDNPMPARLNEPARKMFETLGPELPFYQQIVFANLWLLKPVLLGQLANKKTTNATIRTTTAVTVVRGGDTENVLPQKATAKVNFRIAPGETIEDVERHVRQVVGDERVEIETPERNFMSNPSPISRTETEAYRKIGRSVRRVFGEETIVAPALMLGGTDSRHYTDIADDVYRFIPMILGPEDTERIHGLNERIGVDNYRNIVRFYMEMMD